MPPPDPERLKVFLCHGSEDKAAVRDLYRRLLNDGFQPWLDAESLLPGQDWEYEIRKAVREADVVVVCLSASSASRRGFSQKEIRFALDVADEQPEGEIYVIPLRLEEVDLPERLSRWHWVNYFDDGGYDKLKASLELKRTGMRTAPAPSSDTAFGAADSDDDPDARLVQRQTDPPDHRPISRPIMWWLGAGVLSLPLILWGVWESNSPGTTGGSTITATYDLEVAATTIEWGEPEWTSWGPEVRIPKLGRPGDDFDCTDRANRRDVCVRIPPNSELVLDDSGRPRVEVDKASSWGSWCNGQRTDAVARVVEDQVCKPYWNWQQSVSHTKRIRALVRRITEREETKTLTLENTEGRPVDELLPGRFYVAKLDEVFPSFRNPTFELTVKRSDGIEMFVGPGSPLSEQIFASYDPTTKKYRVRLEPDGSQGGSGG